jgi:glycine/D-amino acid oxidase-like deaminating enzyme
MIERSGGIPADGGADLVVVGAGVMGAWIALRARREGWRTTLIDAFGSGHATRSIAAGRARP